LVKQKPIRSIFIVLLLWGSVSLGAYADEKQDKPVIMVLINEQIWVDDKVIYDYYGSLAKISNIWTSVSQADIFFATAGNGLALVPALSKRTVTVSKSATAGTFFRGC